MFTVYLTAMLHFRRYTKWLSLLLAIVLFAGCGLEVEFDDDDDKKFTSPPGYNLNRPAVFKLPPGLDEISGVAYNAKDNSVLAINDEHGWLYKVRLKDNIDLEKWHYARGADFEDLVLIGNIFYVLVSNGDIISFWFRTPDSVIVKQYHFPEKGKNEFEILYHDEIKKQLVLLCKDCEADDNNSLTAYSFDLQTSAYADSPTYVIDIRKIEDIMEEKKLRFKPSAAAIHPRTGELYIISSINKVLVVADLYGVPKAVYRIKPKLYKQPEGITFTPRGDLIISNEFAEIGAANILFFNYKQTGTP